MEAPPPPRRGLDLVAQLNLAGPRRFLLQAEDDLDLLTASPDDTRSLTFPPLAKSYEDLLTSVATRHGLQCVPVEDRRSNQRCLAVSPGAGELPCASLAHFLAPQRPTNPPPAAGGADAAERRLQRMRARLWAVCMKEEAVESEEEARAALDAALGVAEVKEEEKPRAPVADGRTKRGRGFEEEQAPALRRPRRCYKAFGPKAAKVYLRDSWAKAPWPVAKLRRLADPPVQWRAEWRVGGEDLAEEGAKGGVLSFAADGKTFGNGEGFEVSLRGGPGPPEGEEKEEDDFVLSFRRGEKAWHLAAGKRNRKTGGAQKVLQDDGKGTRRMFWLACAECAAEGKQYVVLGKVPGLLTEHVFVAKVGGRLAPFSHVGISYLPHPGRAAFGDERQEAQPALLESITVFPHGLTGDFPLVSLRYVDSVSTKEDPDAPFLCSAQLDDCVLAVLKAPLENDEERFKSWGRAARRECGLPLAMTEEEREAAKEERLEKRRRMRTEPRPVRQDPAECQSSWEPLGAELPKLGPGEETLLHDPVKRAQRAEAAEAVKVEERTGVAKEEAEGSDEGSME